MFAERNFLGKWRKAPNGPVYLWSCNLPSSYETAHAVAVDYELKKPNRGMLVLLILLCEVIMLIYLRNNLSIDI